MSEYKTKLKEEKEKLTAELQTIAVHNEETGDWVAKPDQIIGEADGNVGADTTEEWNERRAMMAQLETRYHNVILALKKFDSNSFGQCEICNEKIEVDRLDANNAARTCKLHLERERELPL